MSTYLKSEVTTMERTKCFFIPLMALTLVLGGCSFNNGNSNHHKDEEEYFSDGSVTGVTLDKSSISISVGASYQLSATIAPKDAINTNITWSVEDESVATVSLGKVSGVAVGKTTVTVTTEDGGFTASCEVEVVSEGGTDDGGENGEDTGTEDDYDPTGNENVTVITEAGTYTYKGEIDKQIYINAPDAKVTLSLEGVTLNYSENSPIYIATADKVEISAKKDKVNVINDNREVWTEDVDGQGKGAIYAADGDLEIKGKGSLTINANYYNGIHGKDDVEIKNLTLNVNAVNHGIKGNDSITVESGTLNIVCGGDGLKTENSDVSSKGNQRGNVTINGGAISIDSFGDAIDASYNAVFEELEENEISFTAKTNKFSSYNGEVVEPDTTKLYLKLDSNTYSNGNYTFACYINNTWYKATYLTTQQSGGGPGGGSRRYVYVLDRPSDATSFVLYRFSGSNVTSFSTTNYNAKSETKSFNSYYDSVSVSTSGTTLTFGNWSTYTSGGGGMGPGGQEGNNDKASNSAKGVKAANEIQIISGTLDIKAYDDGLHANADATLENGYAPLGNITVSGGNTSVYASDDGLHADNILSIVDGEINVTQSYEGLEGNVIKVSGGKTTIYSSDDGVNACKGTATPQIIVSGGYLDVTVPTSGDTDGIDSNGSYTQSGGVVVVRGPGSASGSWGGGAFALDAESTIKVTGGSLIVFGGIERTPSTSGVTKTICSSSSVSSGNHTVSFTDGTSYDCYLKNSANGCVVYSELGSATLK